VDANLFFYIVLASAAVMAALWYFIIAPLERRKYERKLEILQQKITRHEEVTFMSKAPPPESDAKDDATNQT
jgi:hypothetical protein